MRHLASIAVFSLTLSTLTAHGEMISITPEQVGQIFCISSLGNDMTPAGAMLTDGLSSLIDSSFERSNEYLLTHPDEKPPLGDGIPWRTYPDYADGCTVGESSVRDLVATVTINYAFSEYPEANYSNALILIPSYAENGPPYIWRIDDVDLGNGTTLRDTLAATFADYGLD